MSIQNGAAPRKHPNATLIPTLKSFLPAKIFNSTDFLSPDPKIASMDMEFNDDLLTYMSFPGSATRFQRLMTEDYMMRTYTYFDNEGYPYKYKHDLLVGFDAMVSTSMERKIVLLSSIKAFYLKTRELDLAGIFEMVRFEKETFDEFEKQFRTMIKTHLEKEAVRSETDEELSEMSLDYMFDQLKQILRLEDDHDTKRLFEIIHCKGLAPIKGNETYYCAVLNLIRVVIGSLRKFIEDHEEWFQSRHYVENYSSPTVIRIFVDGPKSFCLRHEVELAYDKKMFLDIGCLSYVTMSYEEAIELLKRHGRRCNEKFVLCPIFRARRRAVPIPLYYGEHAILASDVLLEILLDMIWMAKAFQIIDRKKFSIVRDLFDGLESTFLFDRKEITLIPLDKADGVRQHCSNYFDKHLGHLSKNAKTIKPVGPK